MSFITQPVTPLVTRRDFLVTLGMATGGLSIGVRTLSAAGVGSLAANAFLDKLIHSSQLKALAARALEVAKQAGASYADIRLAHKHRLQVSLLPSGVPTASIEATISYGVRTIVNGAVAFTYGNIPTVDAVVRTTRNAVKQARGFATLSVEKVEMVPAPIVQGEWSTPYEIDPFTVPILEQGDLLGALSAPIRRVEGAGGSPSFDWEHEIRVSATSEGSLTTQVFQRSRPDFGIGANWIGQVSLDVPGFRHRLGGYETMLNPTFPDRIKEHAEYVKRYAMIPEKQMDIGRYPVVLDGQSVAMTLAHTVGPGLQMDRVLGFEADASGTSFLSPPRDVLGAQIFSPYLSVTAGRPLTDLSGAKWDDECVEPESFPVITKGTVIDYITDRQTSPSMTTWYQNQGRTMKSRGFATARQADHSLVVGAGHLAMASSTSRASAEDLCRDVKRGIFVVNARYINTDQQLISGQFYDGGCLLLELKDGKVVGRIRGVGLQFKTSTFWKGLTAIGDSSTADNISTQLYKGQPWQMIHADASAPAGQFKSVDVISLGGH